MCNCSIAGRFVRGNPNPTRFTEAEDMAIVASLRKVAAVESMSLWICPDGHYWEKLPCSPLWSNGDPSQNGTIFNRVAVSTIEQWCEHWRRQIVSHERVLREKIREYENRGYVVAQSDQTSAVLYKETSGFLKTKRIQCLIAIDYQGRLFGQENMNDPDSRWGVSGPW